MEGGKEEGLKKCIGNQPFSVLVAVLMVRPCIELLSLARKLVILNLISRAQAVPGGWESAPKQWGEYALPVE